MCIDFRFCFPTGGFELNIVTSFSASNRGDRNSLKNMGERQPRRTELFNGSGHLFQKAYVQTTISQKTNPPLTNRHSKLKHTIIVDE
jgi:hypothetical protein